MKAYIYQLDAVTNMQVGNGEVNFGVVDNLIQRDAATNFPVINASGIKGALREYFKDKDKGYVRELFGSEPTDTQNHESGKLRFFDANLIAMPVRCNNVPYLMGTCPMLINDYISKCGLFEFSNGNCDIKKLTDHVCRGPVVLDKEYGNSVIEDCSRPAMFTGNIDEETMSFLRELIDGPVVLFSDDEFKRLCDNDHLPVIARNNLSDNNRNLWYEQVLPRFSRLRFFVLAEESKCIKNFKEDTDGKLIQVGANATVGYGYCKLSLISECEV
ncbi:type III-B CRISPR module RAMP protein Cmr4 [Xylanibacter muris]|uniref:Type III-B CRISPR module RAMP protein Cmr4 n=1 Tax=Xylanibacter muris TaxID=2736290 RepID=A0ABX2AND2_9BACT|nr:type III-B CRISPR module RAMP protein Cmr4 [Xylanibacter muris]NPD92738.1 type III-B CRISPR module RAMP protein Cmr4 [Xylanibacter muris]